MRRRAFNAHLLLVGAGIALGPLACAPRDEFVARLRGVFGPTLPDAIRLGSLVGPAQFPDASASELLEGVPAALRESGSDLAAAVERRIRDDFDGGATVDVGGWVLSTTEARLYALLASSATFFERPGPASDEREWEVLSHPRPLEKVEVGLRVFERHCASCHDGEAAAVLTGRESPLIGKKRSAIARTIMQGRQGARGAMPAFKSVLDYREFDAVGRYLMSTLRSSSGG